MDVREPALVARLPLTSASVEEVLRYLSATVHPGSGRSIHLVNSYTAVLAERDPAYLAALSDRRAVLLVDGTPLVWLSRMITRSPFEGVRGPTLMRAALLGDHGVDRRHFLLGSTDANLQMIKATMAALGREGRLVGTYSPPFGPIQGAEWEHVVEQVLSSNADVVWVGLGTPLQDTVSVRLARDTSASVVAVGAAFDFLAGTKREAPRWLHGTGLEWLYRLGTEPKRLWRRYLVGNAQFIRLAAREVLWQRIGRHRG